MATVTREREELIARLMALSGRYDMTATERYEADAEAFYRETGYLSPGKDVPMAMGGQDERERRNAYDVWSAKRNQAQQAAILEAAAALASAPPAAPPEDARMKATADRLELALNGALLGRGVTVSQIQRTYRLNYSDAKRLHDFRGVCFDVLGVLLTAASAAPPDPPGLASLTRSLCEALWDLQSSPDCWCPPDRSCTEPHTEACAEARAVNGAAKRFHLYNELPLAARQSDPPGLLAKLRETLETVLASAHPHPERHPAMSRAWAQAREVLAALPASADPQAMSTKESPMPTIQVGDVVQTTFSDISRVETTHEEWAFNENSDLVIAIYRDPVWTREPRR